MTKSIPDFDLEWVPLRIFVVWHPAYKTGPELANDLHSWFGGPNRAWHRAGLGIPVMFWTSLDSDTPPRSIPTDTQAFTVVVPLVDEHFAALRGWRDWIEEGIPSGCQIRFWAVHPAAFRIERLSPINPLGTRHCTSETLRRLLTESCSLLLVAQRRSRSEGSLSFFISYARKDGASVAADVRRALLEYESFMYSWTYMTSSQGGDGRKDLKKASRTGLRCSRSLRMSTVNGRGVAENCANFGRQSVMKEKAGFGGCDRFLSSMR
jgi:hypothetical protein